MIIETIRIRHSTRKFLPYNLSEDEKKHLKEFMAGVSSLHSRHLEWVLTDHNKGSGVIYAPCPDKSSCLVEYGFQGEQIVLELTKMNLATCWNASIKINAAPAGIVVGKEETGKLSLNDLLTGMGKRKELPALVEGPVPQDEKLLQILEACRLAPSAMNRQPWKFSVQKDGLYIWTKSDLLGNHHWLDLGIVLAHAFLAAKEFFKNVSIEKAAGEKYRLIMR